MITMMMITVAAPTTTTPATDTPTIRPILADGGTAVGLTVVSTVLNTVVVALIDTVAVASIVLFTPIKYKKNQ